jgi:hypothetical protein
MSESDPTFRVSGHHGLLVEAGVVSPDEKDLTPDLLVERGTTADKITQILNVLRQELGNISFPVELLDKDSQALTRKIEQATTLEDLDKALGILSSIRNTLRRGTLESKLMYQTLQMLETAHQEDPTVFNDKAREYIAAINRAYQKIAKFIDLHQDLATQTVAQAVTALAIKRDQLLGK